MGIYKVVKITPRMVGICWDYGRYIHIVYGGKINMQNWAESLWWLVALI
jgi:hypothetical protein